MTCTCELCKRELTPDETAYRCFLSKAGWGRARLSSLCGTCQDKERAYLWGFRPSEPCHNCGRPVAITFKRRKPPKHLACGEKCRITLYNRNALARRRKVPQPATCEGCGSKFTPKRRDAKWCSTACKQHAYRVRAS